MPAVIFLAYLSLFTLGLADNVRGPYFPDILQELGLSGTAGSAFFAVTSLFAFFGSWFCHRLIYGRNVLIALALTSFAFSLGFAGISQSPSFAILMIFCALYGWGYGNVNVLQNVLVCEAAPEGQRRRYLNGLQGMYGLAALAAPLTASFLRSLGFGWRTGLFVMSLPPLAVSIGAVVKRHQRLATLSGEVKPAKLTAREWRLCAAFSFLMAAYLWGELSLSTRVVHWLRAERGFTPREAEMQLAIFFFTLLAGRLFFAFIPLQRIGNWTLLTLSALGGGGLYLLGLHVSPWFMGLTGLLLAPFFPVMMDQTSHYFREKGAQAVGVIISVGNLSVMTMHMVIGMLSDSFGLSAAMHCGPGALLLTGAGLILTIPWRRTS